VRAHPAAATLPPAVLAAELTRAMDQALARALAHKPSLTSTGRSS